jgi:hypothetical protein
MIGNVSKSKGFKGDKGDKGDALTYDMLTPEQKEGLKGVQGDKGDTPVVTFRYDEKTGNLYYSSDGILIDKEYIDSNELVTEEELQEAIKNIDTVSNKINKKVVDSKILLSDALTEPKWYKILGKTERATEPTFDMPCEIETAKNPIIKFYNTADPGSLYDARIPYELCDGDYVEVDIEKQKVIHKRTKTKWVATEESLSNFSTYGMESGTPYFNIDVASKGMDNTVPYPQTSKEGYSNVFCSFVFDGMGQDNSIYVNDVSVFYGMTDEKIKEYLIDNNCVVYFDLDEPVITEYDANIMSYDELPDFVIPLLYNICIDYENPYITINNGGTIEISYIADVNSVIENAKQESKEYTDKAIAEIDIPQADVSGKVDVVDENGNFYAGNIRNDDVTNNIWIGNETYSDYNDNIAIGNDIQCFGDSVVIGHRAKSHEKKGISIGLESFAEGGGICIGKSSYAEDGISIGHNSDGHKGIAIGHEATVHGEDYESIDAIQLGTGHNNQEGTLKIYDHLLMRADGSLPYVDKVVGDINSALDELHQYALSLQGGSAE